MYVYMYICMYMYMYVCMYIYIFIYYIDTDEISGFFLLLKNHIFIMCSEDTIVIFHV